MEEWKAIKDYEGLYEVSNFGRVRSLDRWVRGKNNSLRLVKGRTLKPITSYDGYLKVSLSKKKTITIHRLVVMAFILNPNNKPHINHIDGNKQNNHISNLEWCTMSENQTHAFKNGLQSNKGEKNGNSSLTNDDVVKIRQLLSDGLSLKEIGEMFGVTYQTIGYIKTGKLWTHI